MHEDNAIRQTNRRWRLRHFVLLGVVLGFVLPAALGIHNWSIRRSILNFPAPDGLPDQAADAFQTFKQYLAFHVEGTHASIAPQDGVTVIKSPLLAKEFPKFIFFQVKFKTHEGYDCICAMPLAGGPNWCFHQHRMRDVVAFLGWTGRTLRTHDAARTIRQIVGELTANSFLTDQHEQDSESQWRIGINRNFDSTLFLEINVDQDGVVESGLFTLHPN